MCSSSATTESLKPHKIVRICVLIANIVSDGASLCTKYVRWRTQQCSKFGNSVSLINTRLENRLIEDTSHELASKCNSCHHPLTAYNVVVTLVTPRRGHSK